MIKDENEDPSLAKKSGREGGGKAGGEKHARTGAYYLWPRVLCSFRMSMRGIKSQKYFEKRRQRRRRRKEGDGQTGSGE